MKPYYQDSAVTIYHAGKTLTVSLVESKASFPE